MYYQQGDVLIIKVSEIKGKKLNHLILATGEATGHNHVITEGEAELYEEEGKLYLKVNSENAILTHQEHKEINLPKGNYEIDRVKEYDHFLEESRRVND